MKPMKFSTSLMRTPLILGGVMTVTLACSQVEFAPGPKEQVLIWDDEDASATFKASSSNPKLDILIIDDNSFSMYAEQEKMGEKFRNFLKEISDTDWQLAITTTDTSDGPFGLKGELLDWEGTGSYIMTKDTPNADKALSDTITREETLNCSSVNNCPTGNEEPLKASILAMEKRNTANRGFFRNDADLVIFILSDEDEMSSGPGAATSSVQVVNAFTSIWRDTKRLMAFGIIIQPGDQGCLKKQEPDGHYGSRADDLVQITGGLTGSICSNNYGSLLSKLGSELRKRMQAVLLADDPIPGSISVKLNPDDPNVKWAASGRKITFSEPLNDNTDIEVKYRRKSKTPRVADEDDKKDKKDKK